MKNKKKASGPLFTGVELCDSVPPILFNVFLQNSTDRARTVKVVVEQWQQYQLPATGPIQIIFDQTFTIPANSVGQVSLPPDPPILRRVIVEGDIQHKNDPGIEAMVLVYGNTRTDPVAYIPWSGFYEIKQK